VALGWRVVAIIIVNKGVGTGADAIRVFPNALVPRMAHGPEAASALPRVAAPQQL